MVAKFVKEECVKEVSIGNVVIMLLLYADDVVLLANTLGYAQSYEGIGKNLHAY